MGVEGEIESPDNRAASESASSSESIRCSPADAHHMKPEYASAAHDEGSMMLSVSGRSSIRSLARRDVPDELARSVSGS